MHACKLHRHATAYWVVLIASVTFADTLQSQESQATLIVEDRVACASCTIQVERVLTIGAKDGPNIVVGYPYYAMARDSRGNHFVVAAGDGPGWEVRVYDKEGRYVRSLGREGAGPGEFSDVTGVVVMPGDSLTVLDPGNGRLTVLTPAWKVARTVRLGIPYSYHPVYIDAETFVVNSRFRTPERAGIPLHTIGSRGELTRSFGSDNPEFRADTRLYWWRTTARDPSGRSVWGAFDTQYVIEEWSVDGELQRRVIREASWFRPYLRQEAVTPEDPPGAHVSGIQVDSSGLIWAAVSVAAKDYAQHLAPAASTIEGQRAYEILDVSGLADTVIEVIDPKRGLVLARAKIDQLFAQWIAPGMLATYRTDDDVPYIDVWKVSM